MSNKRLISFFSALVGLIISSILLLSCYHLNSGFVQTGIEAFSYIATFPMVLMFYIMLFIILISSFITSIRAIGSELKVIKIFSITFLILTKVYLGFAIYLFVNLLNFA